MAGCRLNNLHALDRHTPARFILFQLDRFPVRLHAVFFLHDDEELDMDWINLDHPWNGLIGLDCVGLDDGFFLYLITSILTY